MIILPIPLIYKGVEYHGVEVGDVTAGLLADTQKVLETGDTYNWVRKEALENVL